MKHKCIKCGKVGRYHFKECSHCRQKPVRQPYVKEPTVIDRYSYNLGIFSVIMLLRTYD